MNLRPPLSENRNILTPAGGLPWKKYISFEFGCFSHTQRQAPSVLQSPVQPAEQPRSSKTRARRQEVRQRARPQVPTHEWPCQVPRKPPRIQRKPVPQPEEVQGPSPTSGRFFPRLQQLGIQRSPPTSKKVPAVQDQSRVQEVPDELELVVFQHQGRKAQTRNEGNKRRREVMAGSDGRLLVG